MYWDGDIGPRFSWLGRLGRTLLITLKSAGAILHDYHPANYSYRSPPLGGQTSSSSPPKPRCPTLRCSPLNLLVVGSPTTPHLSLPLARATLSSQPGSCFSPSKNVWYS